MLTAERLREILDYDSSTGIFRWKITPGRRIGAGDRAGCAGKFGYFQIRIARRTYRAHRLAWLHTHGEWPKDQIDHVDGDKANNRIANLREANCLQNLWNRGPQSNNRCGFKGVHQRKDRKSMWRADIRVEGQKQFLGYFRNPEEAHAAYCRAAAKLHGEFARFA